MLHGALVSRATPAGAAPRSRRRLRMTWQTPQACDFRFGFEITMYVAAR
jgi:pyrroloquinoline quinone biosynthesis protein A